MGIGSPWTSQTLGRAGRGSSQFVQEDQYMFGALPSLKHEQERVVRPTLQL